jgi:hypothetical protein
MAKVYIRPKDKIERYIDIISKKHNSCEFSSGLRSRYYTISGKVLRISDHIGTHNDAYISIIIPSFNTGNNYIIHAHNGGQISIVDYEKAKEIVRTFFYLSSIFCEVGADRTTEVTGLEEKLTEKKSIDKMIKDLQKLDEYKKKSNVKSKTILGLPMDNFTSGQLKQIMSYINQNGDKVED